jgi:two-component system invasion response regulator UvrY
MLSTYPEKQYAVRCIKLGAAGYLNKSADPDDMVAAVRKVAAGGVYVTPATAEALASAVGGASARTGPEALSHREYQVFRLLTAGQSVSEIGAQLGLARQYRQHLPRPHPGKDRHQERRGAGAVRRTPRQRLAGHLRVA